MSLLGDAFNVIKTGAGSVLGGIKSGVKVVAGAAQDVWATFEDAAGSLKDWAEPSTTVPATAENQGGSSGLPALKNVVQTKVAGVPLYLILGAVVLAFVLRKR